MKKIKFWKYVWLNSKVTLFFIVFIFPMFTLLASLHDGEFVPDFLWLSGLLLLATFIGDYYSWKKK